MRLEYKIITASSADELTRKVNELMEENCLRKWKPDGSHHVVEIHRQNRYSGNQMKDTVITVEYSQTMKKVI